MGRRWVFAFGRPLSEAEEESLKDQAGAFFAGWNSHGAINVSQWRLVDNQFLVVYVPDQEGGPSGCSIDALSHFIAKQSEFLNVPLLDEHHVVYQTNEGQFTGVSRAEFKRLVESGEIVSSVKVVDTSAFHVSEREVPDSENDIFSSFLVKASDSWHKKYWA